MRDKAVEGDETENEEESPDGFPILRLYFLAVNVTYFRIVAANIRLLLFSLV